MKPKIIKVLFILAEIGVVAWAIVGMNNVMGKTTSSGGIFSSLGGGGGSSGESYPHLGYLLFYFLSAVLILYLLRRYGRNN
ncbi:hypothetical protein ACFL06_00720 [Patescibacteria group bacterium]